MHIYDSNYLCTLKSQTFPHVTTSNREERKEREGKEREGNRRDRTVKKKNRNEGKKIEILCSRFQEENHRIISFIFPPHLIKVINLHF